MSNTSIEHDATIWMVNDTPTRMVYAGHRWRITDTPTRIRENVWSAPLDDHTGLYGWRFQATDGERVFVFDVYRGREGWHVHRAYV